MPKVLKGNKQLTVAEEKVNEFLQMGYNLIDDEGKIVKAGQATTLKDIKAENDTLKAKYSELEKENEALKAQAADLTAQLEAATKGKSK
jgi:predicted nuclease with TOPRIM domain